MLKLEPITTTNLIALLQFAAVAAGFYFSWRSLSTAAESLKVATNSLGVATANAQAQLYNQLLIQGRDLNYKSMEILKIKDEEKQAQFIGMIISYFAGAFEMRQVLNMPDSTMKLMDNELKELLREDPVDKVWKKVRSLHSKEFNKHVEQIRGV